MRRQVTAQPPTLEEIAHILGIQPDEALQRTIEGKLLVFLDGSQTIMGVVSKQPMKNQPYGKLIILTKQSPNHTWQARSC
jgi:hypothetical protein